MSARYTAIFVVLAAALTSTAAAQPSPSALLSKKVGEMRLDGKLVPEVCGRLATIAGLPVAVESLDDLSFIGPNASPAGTRIDLDLSAGTTVAAALDCAVAADPRYEWRLIGNWLHVMPRHRPADYPLDLPFVGPLPVGPRVGSVLRQLTDPYLPDDWGVQFVVLYGRPVPRPDEVPPPPCLTVREAIDVILWRAGGGCWGTVPVEEPSFKGTVLTVLL